MAKFIILRDESAGSVLESLRIGPAVLGQPGAEPSISVETLGPTELREASRDPGVLGIARAMPTRLIAPEPGADTASGDATWGVQAVGADRAVETGAGVRVAVLDTGIDADHPAFAGVSLTQRDFTGSGTGDVNGHGSHCAGTVFGRTVEGQRIGVAPGVTDALIGKVLGDDGSGSSEMLFDAMLWASSGDCQVVSMSLGFDFPGLIEDLTAQGFPALLAGSVALEAYRMNLRVFDRIMALIRSRAAFNGGTVVVAASGNESRRDIDPQFEVSASVPAAAEGVVSVGALGQSEAGLVVAAFSNTNPMMAAPGVDVLSAKTGGGLVALRGTSMATPHVAGLAALWWERLRVMGVPATAEGVVARLRAACVTDVFAPGTDILDRGEGLAQAPAAGM